MTDHPNRSAASEHPQISFLREAANYFRNRPTHGEDSAFWSNVANADNCEKAANLIERMLDAAQPAPYRGNDRDIEKHPYTPDEQRVAQWFFDKGIGGGPDPIGSMIASHEAMAAERNELRATLSRSSAGNEQVAREASDLADKIEHALRTEGKVTLHQTDGTRALYAVRKLFADEPQAVATPAFDALAAEVIDRISERYNKLAASPLGMATAWERKASGGKPLLYGGKRGLLASGTIATWDEFDLIADVINNLPTLLAACSVSRPQLGSTPSAPGASTPAQRPRG